jgi:hypothetical protein
VSDRFLYQGPRKCETRGGQHDEWSMFSLLTMTMCNEFELFSIMTFVTLGFFIQAIHSL